MSEAQAIKAMQRARADLLLSQPFFGTLAMHLDFQADAGCKTAMTDGIQLVYNPDFVLAKSHQERVFLVAHEVMHCALHHTTRRGDRDPKRWNIAADYAINGMLDAQGLFVTPADCLIDPQYTGRSADDIYIALGDNLSEDGSGSTGEFADAPEGESGPGKGPAGIGTEPGQGAGGEQGASGEPGPGARAVEKLWDVACAQAGAAQAASDHAKGAGGDSDAMARITQAMQQEAIPNLLDVLREYLTRARNQPNWKRPNKRHAWRGIYLPSRGRLELVDVLCAVDTSGSVSAAELEKYAGILSALLAEFPQTTIQVVYCDYYVQGQETFSVENVPIRLNAQGGGGRERSPFSICCRNWKRTRWQSCI